MLWTKALRVFGRIFQKIEYAMQPDYGPETVRISLLLRSYVLVCILRFTNQKQLL